MPKKTDAPPGDERTVEQAIEDNPAMRPPGLQKDIHREGLKQRGASFDRRHRPRHERHIPRP